MLDYQPQVWMRARLNSTLAWVCRDTRGYLYAGKSKGAQVAAWQQVARAEAAARFKAAFGKGLLHSVKAFERMPRHISTGPEATRVVSRDPPAHNWRCSSGNAGSST